MKKIIIFLSLLTLLNSCATILNSPFQKVNIYHEEGLNVRVDTSRFYYRESVPYNVYYPKNYNHESRYFIRSSCPIPLIVNESDTIILKPHRSYLTYWLANLYFNCGIGMLVDCQEDKSYEYPVFNYIARVDGSFRNIRFSPYKKNSMHLSIGLPLINGFRLQTDSGKVNTGSGFGISANLEYFFDPDTYISLGATATLDLFYANSDTNYYHSFRTFGPYFDSWSSTRLISIGINRMTPKLDYGLGFTLASLRWSSNEEIALSDTSFTFKQADYKSVNLGMKLSMAYRLSPGISLGFEYHPLFYDIERNRGTYQHFINFRASFRF